MPHSFFRRGRAAAVFAAVCIALTATAHAQNSPGPQPVPLPPPIVAPADTPYPGTISLLVDVTNITDRVLSVHETIPIKGRDITLLYPEWLPGTHSPSNPVGRTCRPCCHGEWQTHSLGARPREHVRIPCRGAAGCSNAGYKFPVPGPAGSKTRSHFLEVRQRYLEQRAAVSGGILLAGYQIRTCASLARGMEVCQRAGCEIAERQPGSVQRHAR